jgi:outer membrane protein OmpA-like peptidoglycan-associated protein
MNHLAISATLLLVYACAAAPRPAILSEIDVIRDNGSTRQTRELVPQADARAEKLYADAEAAWRKGQTASAEILGERAIVAYSDTRELARIVRVERRILETSAAVHEVELSLLKLESDQKKAAAEAADLEAQLRVEREAEAIADPKLSTPDREQARLVAAKTAIAHARLLCITAKLLSGRESPSGNDVTAALSEVDEVEAKLAAGKFPVSLRDAMRARSRCQQLLAEVRRPTRLSSPTSEQPDQLFVELTEAGYAPSRDDRGIVVTLNDAFVGDGLDKQLVPKLTDLGRLAQSHDQTPLLVVTHSKKGDPKPSDQQRADAVAAKLQQAGVKNLQAQAVGGRLPIAQNSDLGAARRNERLEVIFVTQL